ncbi:MULTISPECIES: DedA family protein [Streptomyces]|uniref:DedA family protein n=1 Tax=Streptomyces TaxID=1883 RepID=UPI0004C53C5C|nr:MULTISPECIES: DedA family protein [Streptomyces]KOX45624.1 membrane protein DedA family protein [Streptomyces sp. NRRL F-7442]NEB63148.1 DedA family protein [Streptomyces diastaticus]
MDHIPLALPQEPADGIAGWAADLVDAMGAPGAGLAVALENVFPPLPSEIILPLTGFAAGQGVISLFAALFWTTLGSVVGAAVLYWIGALVGRERMYAIWAKLPLVKTSDLERTEEWFAKHGTKAVFLGRMVPIFRSLISVPAGLERMPLPTFLALTGLGTLTWNTVLVMSGYWLGDQWDKVGDYVGVISKAVLVMVVLALAFYILVRLRSRGTAQHRRSS